MSQFELARFLENDSRRDSPVPISPGAVSRSGFTGPLYQCSIYGNKKAGEKLKQMLSMGLSKPWPEALKAMTGEDKMDATAIIDYFAPLKTWLDEENQKAGSKR